MTLLISIEMTNWSTHLHQLGFCKVEGRDGSERYYCIPGSSPTSFWTQILVNPIDSCWQVTYSRSEAQVGFWETHSIVTKIEVNFHCSSSRMIKEITNEIDKQPGFLQRFS